MRLLRLVVLSVLGASFLLACGSDDEKGGGGGSGGSTGGACVPTAAECYQAGPTGPGAECLAKAPGWRNCGASTLLGGGRYIV